MWVYGDMNMPLSAANPDLLRLDCDILIRKQWGSASARRITIQPSVPMLQIPCRA